MAKKPLHRVALQNHAHRGIGHCWIAQILERCVVGPHPYRTKFVQPSTGNPYGLGGLAWELAGPGVFWIHEPLGEEKFRRRYLAISPEGMAAEIEFWDIDEFLEQPSSATRYRDQDDIDSDGWGTDLKVEDLRGDERDY